MKKAQVTHSKSPLHAALAQARGATNDAALVTVTGPSARSAGSRDCSPHPLPNEASHVAASIEESQASMDAPGEQNMGSGFPYGYWSVRKNVIASAKPYDTIGAWRKARPGAYMSARNRGWLPAATAHMNGYTRWTKKLLLEDASRFSSPSAWKAASPSAYATARNRHMLVKCCVHMTRIRKTVGYWTREKCIESALRFQTIAEWTEQDGGAVDAAFRNDWYDDATEHMIELVSYGAYCIRRLLMRHGIAFECEKTYEDLKDKRLLPYDFFLPVFDLIIEYHGEQHDRDPELYTGSWDIVTTQRHDKIKRRYAKKKKIAFLVVRAATATEIERIVKAKLRQIARARPDLPNLGQRRELTEEELLRLATYGRWTEKNVLEDARNYTEYGDWVGTCSYQAAYAMDMLEEASKHMTRTLRPRGYWTLERLKVEALKYTTRKEWQKTPGAGYHAALRQGVIDVVAPHLVPLRKTWTLQDCNESAQRYGSRKEWSKAAHNAYVAAQRNGWLEACCAHMEWRSTKPKEKYAAKSEARARSTNRTSSGWRRVNWAGTTPLPR